MSAEVFEQVEEVQQKKKKEKEEEVFNLQKMADIVIAHFAKRGFEIVYEPLNKKLYGTAYDGVPESLILSKFYKAYITRPPEIQHEILEEIFRILSMKLSPPPPLEEVREHVKPRIRSLAYHFLYKVEHDVTNGNQRDLIPHRVLSKDAELAVDLVLDLPGDDLVTAITHRKLKVWGVEFDDLLDSSIDRMKANSRTPWQSPGGFSGLHIAFFRDGADAARIMHLQLIRSLEVRGDPVAMLPCADMLVVAGSEDEDAMLVMIKLVGNAGKEIEKPMCSAYVLREGEDTWSAFIPPKGVPSVFWTYRDLYFRGLAADYDSQMKLLTKHQELFEVDEDKRCLVSRMAMMQHKESGEVLTYCIWQMGVSALLPKTDLIMFTNPNTIHQPFIGRATWEDVEKLPGNLMRREPDVYPVRYRVFQDKFPTPQQLVVICSDMENFLAEVD